MHCSSRAAHGCSQVHKGIHICPRVCTDVHRCPPRMHVHGSPRICNLRMFMGIRRDLWLSMDVCLQMSTDIHGWPMAMGVHYCPCTLHGCPRASTPTGRAPQTSTGVDELLFMGVSGGPFVSKGGDREWCIIVSGCIVPINGVHRYRSFGAFVWWYAELQDVRVTFNWPVVRYHSDRRVQDHVRVGTLLV